MLANCHRCSLQRRVVVGTTLLNHLFSYNLMRQPVSPRPLSAHFCPPNQQFRMFPEQRWRRCISLYLSLCSPHHGAVCAEQMDSAEHIPCQTTHDQVELFNLFDPKCIWLEISVSNCSWTQADYIIAVQRGQSLVWGCSFARLASDIKDSLDAILPFLLQKLSITGCVIFSKCCLYISSKVCKPIPMLDGSNLILNNTDFLVFMLKGSWMEISSFHSSILNTVFPGPSFEISLLFCSPWRWIPFIFGHGS